MTAEARGYIPDWLRERDLDGRPGSADRSDWFARLSEHVAGLRGDDPRLQSAAVFLAPIISDDSAATRIDGLMYPGGAASNLVDDDWGGDFDDYLARLVAALARDRETWDKLVDENGESATWTFVKIPIGDANQGLTSSATPGRWIYGPLEADGGQAVYRLPAPRCGAPLVSERARGRFCGKVAGHVAGHASAESLREAYVRQVIKRYPHGLYAQIARDG
jgi:hypothetical protein